MESRWKEGLKESVLMEEQEGREHQNNVIEEIMNRKFTHQHLENDQKICATTSKGDVNKATDTKEELA